MNRTASKLVIWLMVAVIVFFTATRILDFLAICFPPQQRWMAWPALICFDLGTLSWLYFAWHGAEGVLQRVLAFGMIIIDLLGVAVATAADMLLYAQQHGAVSSNSLPAGFQTVAIMATVLIIVVNFAGLIFIHMADPSFQRKQAQQHSRDYIHEATLQEIQTQSHQIAPAIAREVAERWAREMFKEYHMPHIIKRDHSFRPGESSALSDGHRPDQIEGKTWATED